MQILYCQKMIFPNRSAHAIHTGTTVGHLAECGVPVVFFPGVSQGNADSGLAPFFTDLGFSNLPSTLAIRAIPTTNKGLYGLFFRFALWRALREKKQSICYASSVKEAVMALNLRKLAGTKAGKTSVVFEVHHLISRLKTGRDAKSLLALERKAFAEAEMVVFIGESLQDMAKGYLPEPRRSVVVPLGFNQRMVAPVRDAALPEPGEASGIVHLYYLGSLQPGKGVENLVRAVSLLPEQYQLTILGGRPQESFEALQRQAQAQGIAHRVIFAGQVPQAKLRSELAECDIFVIPMETEEDFFAPMKMYEALGFALPIVATPVSALREQLADGANALIAASTAPQDIAVAIARLGTDPALRRAMRVANAAQSTALSSTARAEALVKIFNEVSGE